MSVCLLRFIALTKKKENMSNLKKQCGIMILKINFILQAPCNLLAHNYIELINYLKLVTNFHILRELIFKAANALLHEVVPNVLSCLT